jgi:hypothetical protein
MLHPESHHPGGSRRRPKFIREITDQCREDGLVKTAAYLLERAKVDVQISGEVSALQQHHGGILFFGNHQNSMEFWPLMHLLDGMSRDKLFQIAKFPLHSIVKYELGAEAGAQILPVWPRRLAKGRKSLRPAALLSKALFRSPDLETIERINSHSIGRFVEELENGNAANIYPCGSTWVNAKKGVWRAGLGRAIAQLSEPALDEVLIVPYDTSRFSRFRFIGSLAAAGRLPMDMSLHLGPIKTAAEVMKDSQDASAEAITATLRQDYINYFEP